MINKREFLKSAVAAGLAAAALPFASAAHAAAGSKKNRKKWKHWVWINPNHNDKEADLQALYASYRDAGIRGIFFEADSELHYRTAKENGIEAHRWMWTMNRGEKELLEK